MKNGLCCSYKCGYVIALKLFFNYQDLIYSSTDSSNICNLFTIIKMYNANSFYTSYWNKTWIILINVSLESLANIKQICVLFVRRLNAQKLLQWTIVPPWFDSLSQRSTDLEETSFFVYHTKFKEFIREP